MQENNFNEKFDKWLNNGKQIKDWTKKMGNFKRSQICIEYPNKREMKLYLELIRNWYVFVGEEYYDEGIRSQKEIREYLKERFAWWELKDIKKLLIHKNKIKLGKNYCFVTVK